jgi:prevent-host-death family protein
MDLRRRLGEILDRASSGERIVVERDRRPLAVLVPYEDALRLEESNVERGARALAALDRLEAFARRMRAESPDGDHIDAVTAIREERQRGHPQER